jgi:hypothetical protein
LHTDRAEFVQKNNSSQGKEFSLPTETIVNWS